MSEEINNEKNVQGNGKLEASIGIKILCFIIPLVGLILYICNVSTNKKYANACGKMALISAIIGIVLLPIIILVIILLLGMGITVFNSSADVITESESSITSIEKETFNSKFYVYEGTNLSSSSVKNLLSMIILEEYNDNYIDIVFNGKTYTDAYEVRNKIYSTSKYSVEFEENSSGIIDSVTITEEIKNVTVPSLVGEKEDDAKRELENLNLKVEIVEEENEVVEIGYVVRQEPIYNTTVEEGTTVKLYVSMGQ